MRTILRSRPVRLAILAAAAGAAALALALTRPWEQAPLADPDNSAQVALGRDLYARYCASCHGAELAGEANWRRRKPTGRMPAPPHDASGHTWHHPDTQLFALTKRGVVPPLAPPGYASDMPGFAGSLSDTQIWSIIAFIKSRWPEEIRRRQPRPESGPR